MAVDVGARGGRAESGEQEAPSTADFSARQGYLRAAPEGVDAVWAHTQAGGCRRRGADHRRRGSVAALTMRISSRTVGGVSAGTPTPTSRGRTTAPPCSVIRRRPQPSASSASPRSALRAASIFGGVGSASAIRHAADPSEHRRHHPDRAASTRPAPQLRSRDDQAGYIALEWWPDDFAAIIRDQSRRHRRRGCRQWRREPRRRAIWAAGRGLSRLWRNPFNRGQPDSGALLVGAGAPPPGTHGRDHGPDRHASTSRIWAPESMRKAGVAR